MAVEFPQTVWTIIRNSVEKKDEFVRHLVSSYTVPIHNFLLARGCSEEDAKDLVQEVFLRVTADSFLVKADKEKGKFRTLLLAVTKHVLIDFIRKEKSKGKGDYRVVHIESLKDGTRRQLDISDPRSFAEDFDRMWLQNLIDRGIEELRRSTAANRIPYYTVLVMAIFEEKPYPEIAKELNAKESDIKNWVHHAKRRLKEIIEAMIRAYSSSSEEYSEEVSSLKLSL